MFFESGDRPVRSSTTSRAASASPLGSPKTSPPRSGGALSRLRAHLLGGASRLGFPAASMAFALGVSLSSGASAQTTFNTNHGSTVNLQNYGSGNPFTVTTGTTISDPANDAIDGSNAALWTLTNNGTVTGNLTGIKLQSQSTVTNAGTIVGQHYYGVFLKTGGGVTNQTGGAISGYVTG